MTMMMVVVMMTLRLVLVSTLLASAVASEQGETLIVDIKGNYIE